MKFALPATLLVFSLCGTASAQTTAEGTIRGVIHDDQGGVLPGVTVVATSPTVAGTFTSVSDAVGAYRLLNLSPGEYSVTAELQGFSKYVRPGIVVRAGLNIADARGAEAGSSREHQRRHAASATARHAQGFF